MSCSCFILSSLQLKCLSIIHGIISLFVSICKLCDVGKRSSCGFCILQTLLPVSLQVEVAAQHHLFMIGRGGSNLQQIMAKTGATICFPDLSSLMSSSKGTIYISGAIDNVLAARECIIVSETFNPDLWLRYNSFLFVLHAWLTV